MANKSIISRTAMIFGIVFSLSILIDYLWLKKEPTEEDKAKGGIHRCRYDPPGVIFSAIVHALIIGSLAFAYFHMTDGEISKGDILSFKMRMSH